ncbi:hypothetical protein PG997_010592 [Apiospora hydei]|uniref:Nephrocystin 3-like N-terminal domain-containing protein n=1 Tax=Apiospora hydei TaxID=1337664 RepID=A0ABR1VGP7_9PEZI
MEALAALGLASNIVSFVDFTWKLLTGANEIYASGAGVANEAEFLDAITKDVRHHNGRIAAIPNATPELQGLVQKCDEIAQEPLRGLEKLRVKGDKTRWKSFLVALHGVRSKKRVEQLTDKISQDQTRISAHIQELLFNQVSGLGRDIRELQIAHTSLGIATKDEVSFLKCDIEAVLERLVEESSPAQMKKYFQQHQSHELSPAVVAKLSDQMRRLASAMDNLRVKGMEASSSQQLLKKLHFTSISTREQKIEKPHARTFEWLVSPSAEGGRPSSCVDFITWLRSGDGVFWIHGKPGSGKSTFMKFVCEQVSVRRHLVVWAKQDQLFEPTFYFWYAGSRLQKSLEGLLRTLLFEMLRQIPGVIPSITSDPEVAVPISYDEDWDLEMLFKIYGIILQQNKNVKFCFFIDGLDEFKD